MTMYGGAKSYIMIHVIYDVNVAILGRTWIKLDPIIEVLVALGGPPGRVWSRILYHTAADGRGREEGCQKGGRQEGGFF